MRRMMRFRVVAVLTISILLLTSCNPALTATIEVFTATLEQTPTTVVQESAGMTPEPSQIGEGTPTPTLVEPTAIPIVETRLPPEQWQEWPVVPELTGRELEIYQRGLTLGNNPTHFSKVGDCQAIKDVLMGIYDTPDRYYLTENQLYLQETIDYFAGSFNRDGQAVKGGYNAAAVISPIWADPEVCNAGETPIECEYRVHKPSFVIISLEVWWEGRTVERYEDYMRQIIEFFIEIGVVPILSTKADNVEGDHRINLATARLAYEYHIPLWNFWRSVQSMPNHGIDPERDGFHISYDAWTVRSFTALQGLDAVWRSVREMDHANIESTQEIPEAEVDFASIEIKPTPQTTSIPLENEKWVFSLGQRSDEVTRSAGIFAYDTTQQTLYEIFGPGYRLEDIDDTGTQLLVSRENELFLSDLDGTTQLISDQFASTKRNASVFWLPDSSRLVLLTEEAEGNVLWRVDPLTDTWEKLAEGEITGIVKPTSADTIYWYQGECELESICEDNAVWRTQAGTSALFFEFDKIAFSFDGETFAWAETEGDNYLMLNTSPTDQTLQEYLYFPGNRLIDLVWSPVENSLILLSATRSDYSGKSSDARVFLVDAAGMSSLEYHAFSGLNPSVYWNEEGDEILLVSTLLDEERYQLSFRQTDLLSGLYDTLDEILTIQSDDFIKVDKLFWFVP